MSNTDQARPTDTRRKLLKSALGASAVVSMGYGGIAAAASITCLQKTNAGPSVNFHIGNTPPARADLSTNEGLWAWQEVRLYDVTPTQKVFQIRNGGAYYSITGNHDPVDIPPSTPLSQSSEKAWSVVYFDVTTNQVAGVYPEKKFAAGQFAQASIGCLNSVNPGVSQNFTFSG
ncbi:hypothetical protein [Zoogloea sp.]|uniref:hypothetical protein n=1 Tax=Zoogloea sp. TaxID=49181 RepID=UPI00260CE549|nr:hypothetical protein [Zoogloea sp.]MDD3353720.1 hypothetical protein [Zoogloea sp.]